MIRAKYTALFVLAAVLLAQLLIVPWEYASGFDEVVAYTPIWLRPVPGATIAIGRLFLQAALVGGILIGVAAYRSAVPQSASALRERVQAAVETKPSVGVVVAALLGVLATVLLFIAFSPFKQDQAEDFEALADDPASTAVLDSALVAVVDTLTRSGDRYVFTVTLTNRSLRDIRAFKGAITARDVFGEEIGAFHLNEYDGVRSGQVEKRRYTWDSALAKDDPNAALRSLLPITLVLEKLEARRLNDLTFEWRASVLVFLGGERVERMERPGILLVR